MDDDGWALRNHRWQERPVEAHGGHQIEVQLLRPFVVAERRKAAARRLGTAEHIDENVDPAKLFKHCPHHGGATLRRGDIGRYVSAAIPRDRWHGARGRDDLYSLLAEHINDGCANAFRAARNERAASFKFEVEVHGMIPERVNTGPKAATKAAR